MPVALVITDLDVGGAERALVSLATGLDRRRWAPTVICLDRPGVLRNELEAAGIPVIGLDADRKRPARVGWDLMRALRETKAELSQSFLFHANFMTRVAAGRTRVRWCVGGIRVSEKRRNSHLLLERLTQRFSLGWVCVSEGVRTYSIAIGGLEPDRLIVIPNGVDPEPFDRAEPCDRSVFGIPADAPLALFIGRMDWQKGVDRLIVAAERVLTERPDAHLLLVGDGPESATFRALAAGRSTSIQFLGRRDDVPALLAMSDLLILPSRWEGMPNVVLEAMAARRAVIGTDIEGTNELVMPGETGWLVPAENAEALANAWLDAIGDRSRLERFGLAGRARVEKDFTPGRVVAQYDELWTRLLGYGS